MKLSYISGIVKILIFAATIIIVCLLCVIAFKTTKEGKSATSSALEQMNDMNANYSSIDKSIYDGSTILGSELVSLIKRTIEKREYLAVTVRTLEGSRTDYNYTYDVTTMTLTGAGTSTIETSKAQGAYINRTAQFLGSVMKDTNDNIICLWFEQIE